MRVFSEAIPADSAINLVHAERGVGGENLSPDLTWSGAPEGTKSYAVTIYDPDAPTGSGWWHWVVYDIPASVTHVPLGEEPPGVSALNDYGFTGYGGPYPPPGPAHRYIHTVHALDVESLGVPADATSAVVRFTLNAHELARASFTATFANPD